MLTHPLPWSAIASAAAFNEMFAVMWTLLYVEKVLYTLTGKCVKNQLYCLQPFILTLPVFF